MSISGALAAGRRAAESRMTSRATIRRLGDPVADPDDPEAQVPGWTVVVADCPGRLAGSPRGGAGSRNVTVGGAEVTLAVREWHMPADSPAPADGDLIEVTEGENAGVVLRVVEASWQDQATARRLPVVEASRPEEWT